MRLKCMNPCHAQVLRPRTASECARQKCVGSVARELCLSLALGKRGECVGLGSMLWHPIASTPVRTPSPRALLPTTPPPPLSLSPALYFASFAVRSSLWRLSGASWRPRLGPRPASPAPRWLPCSDVSLPWSMSKRTSSGPSERCVGMAEGGGGRGAACNLSRCPLLGALSSHTECPASKADRSPSTLQLVHVS